MKKPIISNSFGILIYLLFASAGAVFADDNIYSDWNRLAGFDKLIYRTAHHPNPNVPTGQQWFLEMKVDPDHNKDWLMNFKIVTVTGQNCTPSLVLHCDGSTSTWISPSGQPRSIEVTGLKGL